MNEILRRLQALPEDKKARVVDLMNRYDPTSPGVIEFVSRENLHDRAYRASPSPIRVVRYAKYEAALARIDALEKELEIAKAALAAAPEAKPTPSVPEDVMRDAERYRYLRARDDETAGVGCWIEANGRVCDRGWLYGVQLDSAIDSCIEVLAAAPKPEAKP